MLNPITDIMNQLDVVFSEMDLRVLEESKKWALERQAALYEFLESDESKNNNHQKAFDIAGGKTWYNVFYCNDEEYIFNFITKNCKSIASKRNASITKKLEKVGVKSIVSIELNSTADGFNGVFHINTDVGFKKVTIETVYAGGYNIQCLHLRVLVKIK